MASPAFCCEGLGKGRVWIAHRALAVGRRAAEYSPPPPCFDWMVRSDFETPLLGPHFDDVACLAVRDLADRRFLEVAIGQRPQPVTRSDEPRGRRTIDRVDDLVARDTERKEVDVLDDHHLVVFLDEESIVENIFNLLVVAGRKEPQRTGHTFGSLRQPFPLRVLAQLFQKLSDELFDHRSSRMQPHPHDAGSTRVICAISFSIMRPRPGTRTGSWPSPPP